MGMRFINQTIQIQEVKGRLNSRALLSQFSRVMSQNRYCATRAAAPPYAQNSAQNMDKIAILVGHVAIRGIELVR